MVPSLLSLTAAQTAEAGRRAFLAARGEAKGSGVAGELYGRFFREGLWSPADAGLPEASAQIWATAVDPTPAVRAEAVTTEADPDLGTTAKALFRLADGLAVETVLIPMDGGRRGTLCVSSQVGCAMACAFCQTGQGGLVRNLTAAEIVGQVHAARFALGWSFSSLVFMGMGEPLDNPEAVFPALEVLTDPRGFAFAQDKITLCTVGLAEGLRSLAARGWKRMGLSLSLNGADNGLRERLMPVTRSNPLEALHRALAEPSRRANFVLALNYCLLPGLNDGPDEARKVADFARGLGRVVVNLIPYNPGTPPLTRAPDEAEVDAFLAALRAQGLDARLRGPKGRTIAAACGQLAASRP